MPQPRRIILPGDSAPADNAPPAYDISSGERTRPSTGIRGDGRRDTITRQHPLALVHWSWLSLLVLALAIAWVLNNPRTFFSVLHLYRGNPVAGAVLVMIKVKWVAIGLPLAFAALSFLYTYSYWIMTFIELDATSITYRIGMFSSNSIPRGALQDIQFTRDVPGLIFGYGTITLYAGREAETIPFIPHVEEVARKLRSGG